MGLNLATDHTNILPDNNIHLTATPSPATDKVFCGSHRCSGNSGPHTCARRSFTCNEPDCTWQTPFKTKQALNRHCETKHLVERHDCPVPGCEHVGDKGIKRYDNLVAHVRNQHGESSASGSHGN
ncbi:hypothetical protein L873DRAFT_1843025 [Choiromyces venosus 120613-1]|uniref:C2H2-type domain-containing protein n=1 Tax=Choiromyces venosus 120613-1 TaxID=1336337 RepID=A0A3N4JQ15_9PEZI|nr:hypothetical protein L873DRAFT_1843025 [Choiromyces venosus 120613-1]